MNIQDIKNFLENEPLIKQLKLDGNKPGLLKLNIPLFKQILVNSNKLIKTNSELIYLIRNKDNLENLHIFCECGNKNNFINHKRGYCTHCSIHCKYHIKEKLKKMQNTCEKNSGVKNPYQKPEVKQKIKEFFQNKERVKERNLKAEKTFYKNHGCRHNWASKDPKLNGRATCKERYGDEEIFRTKHFKKIAGDTNERKYGTRFYSQSQEFKDLFKNKRWVTNRELKKDETNEIRYGNKNLNLVPFIKNKMYETMRRNKTHCNPSKPEDNCYNLLLTKFLKDDIERSYMNDKYPFKCDFYVKSLNLYIECHFSQFHQGKPFDKNNKQDLIKLLCLQLKSLKLRKNKDKKNQYDFMIYTWTDLDVRKLQVFKKNNLNYKIFYTEEEFNKWLIQ